MVVRLDFDRQIELIVELDHARVVHEGAAHPRLIQLLRRRRDVRLQQAIGARAVTAGNLRPERLVYAVLRPRLRDGLEFDVGGVSSLEFVIRSDRLHLRQVQREAALLGNLEQPRIGRAAHGDDFHVTARGRADLHERRGDLGIDSEALNHLVDPLMRQCVQCLETERVVVLEALTASGSLEWD